MAKLYGLLMVVSLAALVPYAVSRPNGALPGACVSMVPSHNESAQPSPGPITVTHNIPTSGGFMRNYNYQVTVESSGQEFWGILCQVRDASDTAATRPYGAFTPGSSQLKNLNCNSSFGATTGISPYAAITHTGRLRTNNISFYWRMADGPLPPQLAVVCSVVLTFSNYYVRIPSAAFSTSPDVTAMPDGACPQAQSATTDAGRYQAYLACWAQRFNEWNQAYQRWVDTSGGCAVPSP